MSYIATMGTSSCATISVGGFQGEARKENEEYKKTRVFEAPDHQTAENFYTKVLYPTSQPLGRTHNMPFEKVMEDIAKTSLVSKFIICTINEYQYKGNDNYWPNELNRWGFTLLTKTANSIGTINYIYTRNPSAVLIKSGEH